MTRRKAIPPSYRSNGCGCQGGIMRWFRPPYAATFRAACEWHDFMYHVGGGKADKLRADRGLFKGMVKRAMQVGKTPLQAWWMVCVALCYYGAVRAFGKRSFQWEDKRG